MAFNRGFGLGPLIVKSVYQVGGRVFDEGRLALVASGIGKYVFQINWLHPATFFLERNLAMGNWKF